jgi:DNA-binding transcriptional LysR family regulator
MDHRYKKFLAVARTGSFSAAARELHVTQPAITLAVASLERAFGAKLLLRKKFNVELTGDGLIVADAAKKISQQIDIMRQKLGLETARAQYRIGVIDSIARLLYSSKENPIIHDVEVMVDNSQRIISEILANKIDVGLITGQPKALSKDISIRKLHNEVFVFVCAPYIAPNEPKVKIDDWLAFDQDSTSFHHFSKLFKKIGLQVTPVFYSTSMELLREMAVAGRGTALLPLHIVQASVDNGTLEIVKTKPLDRPIWAIVHRENQSGILSLLAAQVDNLLARS